MRGAGVVWVLFVGLASFSCKDDAVTPPGEVPGRQHDIPWPSLADSPWPMHHGNPQSTGRSRLKGPEAGQIVWSLTLPGALTTAGVTSVAIGPDSTIYFGSSYEPDPTGQISYLYAVSPDGGTVKWKFRIADTPVASGAPAVYTAPLVSSNGTIMIGSPDGYVYALNPSGSLLWRYRSSGGIWNTTMTIGLDGTIYFVASDGYLYALDTDGNLKWRITGDGGFNTSNSNGIASSPDGSTIYVAGTPPTSQTLYAVGIEGAIRWSFDSGGLVTTTPLVDSEGNVYIGPSTVGEDERTAGVFSLRPDGTVGWRYGQRGLSFNEPTMDTNGNLYFTENGGDSLISLDYGGSLRWRLKLPGLGASNALVCDDKNTIYLSSGSSVYAISDAGVILWSLSLSGPSWNSPAIGIEGRVALGSVGDRKVFNFLE